MLTFQRLQKSLFILVIFCFSQVGQAQSPELREKIKSNWLALDTSEAKGQVLILNALAKSYSSFSIDSSSQALNRALHIADINDLDTGMANIYNSLGILKFMTGAFDSSIFYYNKALEVNTRIDLKIGLARNYSNLANVYYSRGDAFTAVENYLLAENHALSLGAVSILADIYNNLSQYYLGIRNNEEAKRYINKSISLNSGEDIINLITQHNNLAVLHLRMGFIDSAMVNYRKAYKICYASNSKESKALVCNNMGQVLLDKNMLDSAFYYHKKAWEESRSIDYYYQSYNANIGMGQVAIARGDYQKASDYFALAYDITVKMEMTEEKVFTLFYKADVDYQLNNYKLAFENYRGASRLNDSINSKEKLRKITELEQRYKFEKIQALKKQETDYREAELQKELAEKEFRVKMVLLVVIFLIITIILLAYNSTIRKKNNKLLLSKNYQIKDQNREIIKQKEELKLQHSNLEELNAFKDKILAVFAHDLRSPLASIQGLLELIGDANLDDLKLFQSFTKKLSSQTIILLQNLENLLAWSKIQLGAKDDNQPVLISELKKETQLVVDLFKPLADEKEVKLYLEITGSEFERLMNFEVARLTLRNFLSNALKFSADQSEILISASCEKELCRFSVKDSGLGIHPTDQQNIFSETVLSTLGTAQETGNGLGLMLCSYFVKEAGGEIGFESTLGKGSEFWFELPLEKHVSQ